MAVSIPNQTPLVMPVYDFSPRPSRGTFDLIGTVQLGPVLTPITFINVAALNNQVFFNFDNVPYLTGDAIDPTKWIFSPTVTTLGVTVIGNSVVVTTTEQIDGKSYSITVPQGIATVAGLVWTGPFNKTFAGDGGNPFITNIYVIDARTIDVSFNEAVYPPDALTKENYTVDNGLQVYSIEQISQTTFRLTTSKQTVGTAYTVTANNIRDFDGNYT